MIKFNILNSINKLVPGARFKGAIKLHTEEEYNDLEQLDPRVKPAQSEIFSQTLKNMRRDIMSAINYKTDQIIEWDMVFDDGTNVVPCHFGIEEQINLDTMDRLREDLVSMGMLVFPYKLKVSDNENGEGNYIRLMNADHLHQFFLMGMLHKNNAIETGRHMKDNLSGLNKTQLEEQFDTR